MNYDFGVDLGGLPLMSCTTLAFKPITPPPLPSHPGIGALQTGHLQNQDSLRMVDRGRGRAR